LDKFHSPANVLNASIAELARIPGLGNMRAEKIRKMLDTPVAKEVDIYTQKKLMIDNTNENTDDNDDARENDMKN
jgi:DNA excision repair protein ERCC-4